MKKIRYLLRIYGRVQGVGFRPFVYNLASELSLVGHVGNDSSGVFIEIEGKEKELEHFIDRLKKDHPPLAQIHQLEKKPITLKSEPNFVILKSERLDRQELAITPDATLCKDCEREILDSTNRRYLYPFTNCTNCGPRYSIIRNIPYDRPQTTMAAFRMCDACQREYEDPRDRRYHAQPNACPDCGPHLWLCDSKGKHLKEKEDVIKQTAKYLLEEKIVAIKGIGGFHLACLASSEHAVSTLRKRKARDAKPFALMAVDIENARELIETNRENETLLESIAHPIVIAERKENISIAKSVAEDHQTLGIMLPSTPLHLILLKEVNQALVMTSANSSGEPLEYQIDRAIEKLASIADYFLMHDREIERPNDDSVLIGADNDLPSIMIRRARGYVPDPIALAELKNAPPILALGGDLKSAFCILNRGQAVLSEHLGDLENPAAYRNFISAQKRLKTLLRADPEIITCDQHPAYHSVHYAKSLKQKRLIPIQHHHAHAVSCMVEHQLPLDQDVLAFSFDGTGYGDDGAIWGGEVFQCSAKRKIRLGHLDYFPLVGGDQAAKETWRPTCGLLASKGEEGKALFNEICQRCGLEIDPDQLSIIESKLAQYTRQPRDNNPSHSRESGNLKKSPIPACSSIGRLFDAAAFVLGIADHNHYEGEAAMLLEQSANQYQQEANSLLTFNIEQSPNLDGTHLIESLLTFNIKQSPNLDGTHLIRSLIHAKLEDRSTQELAAAFHQTLADYIKASALYWSKEKGIETIVFSGGCFANRYLCRSIQKALRSSNLSLYFHQMIPTTDGGLALGQAAIAAFALYILKDKSL